MPRRCAFIPVFALVAALFPVAPAQALSDDVVISQVYGGGGNTGAPYTNDFIELFNRGTTTVSLTGMSVQYASATGTGNFGTNPVTQLSGSLAPGQYYLVQEAGGVNGVPLPTPDATGTANMSSTSGKVALVNSTTGLACNGGSTPCSPDQLAQIKDLVGYGSADFYEGAGTAPTLSNTAAAQRLVGGCTETDSNAADFTAGAPGPRNTSSPLSPCASPDPCTAAYTSIPTIQGNGPTAAITGTVTTQGVVVGDFEGTGAASGFYLQDLTGDADAATSDGLFVYTGSADLVDAGDVVRVTGYARERYGQTSLNGSNSDSSAVPATNLVDCGSGSAAPIDVFMPFADAGFPERYEGMLVRFPQDLVISEHFNYDRYGEIVLALPLPGEERPFTGTAIDEPGVAANARTLANSLRRITLDDVNSAQNPALLRHPNGDPFSLANRFRIGDTVTNTFGILGYDYDLYRVLPTRPADYTAANPRPALPAVGGTLRLAGMNTLNYFLTPDYPSGDPLDNTCGPAKDMPCRGWDSDQADELSRQRNKLLAAMSGLDAAIIGLTELENTTGVEPLADLVSGLPGYAYIDTGTIGTDAIKVGLIYRPSEVTPIGAHQVLDSSDDPRFLDTKNRPTLAQTFQDNVTQERFTVAINHFKSKGSACDDVGDPDTGDGQGECNQTRTDAAKALVDWLAIDPTASGDPDYLVLGDLNSYAQEDPIDAVEAGPDDTMGTADDYTNLIAEYQGAFAYSYVFDGQSGYLDHALASASLVGRVVGATQWHINADEPDVLDYDTSFKPAEQDVIFEPNAYRSSDHDAVVIGLGTSEPTPGPTEPTPGPTEPPPPAVTKKTQTAPKPPKRIKKRAVTVLTKKNARTNAGLRLATKVKVTSKRGKVVTSKKGKVVTYRLRKGSKDKVLVLRLIKGSKGKVSVRTFGRKGWRLVLVQSAPATDTFDAYRLRTVYVNGRRR